MSSLLTAREVCQRLREAALGVLAFRLCETPSEAGLVAVDIEGWHLLLDFEGERLHHCEYARSADGHEGALETWQRYGTDPVSLLSTWELTQIERLLIESPQP
ncbi:hypothetical protein PSH79_16895 [Pseudomonas sp. FP2196]|uniref:DUF7693 family protein n=1 Tax=Pseudomonas sp. FP2196 TaxID=2954086 RepID=UPI0027342F54|nr:hypothetical protein [Pseudomonas sp. FP2196]WLH33608.1 hypothetical protein PSH79_16895 [Pseudomonas sp. FP2196]